MDAGWNWKQPGLPTCPDPRPDPCPCPSLRRPASKVELADTDFTGPLSIVAGSATASFESIKPGETVTHTVVVKFDNSVEELFNFTGASLSYFNGNVIAATETTEASEEHVVCAPVSRANCPCVCARGPQRNRLLLCLSSPS